MSPKYIDFIIKNKEKLIGINQTEKLDFYDCVPHIPLKHGSVVYCMNAFDGNSLRVCWSENEKPTRCLCHLEFKIPSIRDKSKKELYIKMREDLNLCVRDKYITILNPFIKYGKLFCDVKTDEITSIKDYLITNNP